MVVGFSCCVGDSCFICSVFTLLAVLGAYGWFVALFARCSLLFAVCFGVVYWLRLVMLVWLL